MTKQVEPEGTQQASMRSLLKELRAMGQEDGSIGLGRFVSIWSAFG